MGGGEMLDAKDVEIIRAIVNEAVSNAHKEHQCVVGLSTRDRETFDALRVMLAEHNPVEIRENHEFIKWVRGVRNKAGNVFIGVVVTAFTLWAGMKLLPQIFHK